ncbi:MAG TPA: hypothetical protein VF789_03595 [Thermoanaerobaculia bacterium]
MQHLYRQVLMGSSGAAGIAAQARAAVRLRIRMTFFILASFESADSTPSVLQIDHQPRRTLEFLYAKNLTRAEPEDPGDLRLEIAGGLDLFEDWKIQPPLSFQDRRLAGLGVRLRRKELNLKPRPTGQLNGVPGPALDRPVHVSDAITGHVVPFEFEDDPVESPLARRADRPQDNDSEVRPPGLLNLLRDRDRVRGTAGGRDAGGEDEQ